MRTAGQGGRFDATDHQDDKMMDQVKAACTNAILTEGIGVDAPRGWSFQGRETRQYFDNKIWDVKAHHRLRVPTPDWVRGTKPMDHFPLEVTLLARPNRTVLLGGGHFPAHLTKKNQRLANEAALAGLRKALLPVMEDLKPDITNLFFDVNRDLKLEKNRKLVKKSIEGTGLKLAMLPKPDLNGRYISMFLTTASEWETEMLDRILGYDHRGGLLIATP